MIKGTEFWDGTRGLDYEFDDGGRAAAGYKGTAGDCVARSVAIASGLPYAEVYRALADGTGTQRRSKWGKRKGRTAREGILTRRKWFRDYMVSIGFRWVPTMRIGQGCKMHLLAGELPMGRLVVALSKHSTAVIDGVIHDIFDPTRATIIIQGDNERMSHRCVYGYWEFGGND